MAATRRKQDDQNLEALRELITSGDNRHCLDCGTRGPTYVNVTIGSFVCSKCSGMLRGLTPPHRVKSISMATFTPEEMEHIKSRGNEYCRRIWLGLYEGESAGAKDEQSIKDFMADKYEKKRYYLEPDGTFQNGQARKPKKANMVATPLISISPQPLKQYSHAPRAVNSLVPPVNANNFVPRPVNNFVQPTINENTVPAPRQVPEFAADFSTANIYNSSQHQYSNNNNNVVSQPANFNSTSNNFNGTNNKFYSTSNNFNAFNGQAPPSNDRYAALADLDVALRQQKCLNTVEDTSAMHRNPFESSTADIFANKNPFSNGTWTSEPNTLHFNPFAPSPNMSGFSNSKNPFL